MVHKFLFLVFIFSSLSVSAQNRKSLDQKLDNFWKSKKTRALAIAREVTFHSGDTIADVGTADGWFIAALSAFTDSLTFYLEDIDSAAWNRAAFDSAVHRFSTIRHKKVTHRFHHTIGTDTATWLPGKTFHKVLMIDTYHHFIHRDEMLSDAVALLRPGGKIIILEALARRPGDIHKGCNTPVYGEQEIIGHLKAHELTLEKIVPIQKVAGRQNKLFIFVKQ